MRYWRLLIIFLALLSPATADLDRLLQMQQIGDPGAFVSSGFHDWRTVSKYRSRAGLHAGYDIAMLADSPVRAAWSGKVVAITPWYGTEYGVTILDDYGHETTYGHITPGVQLGQQIAAGDILGLVVVDHVDVKMRNSQGYVDFGVLELPDEPVVVVPQLDLEQVRRKQEAEQRFDELALEFEQKHRLLAYGMASSNEVEELRQELLQLEKLVGKKIPELPSEEAKPEIEKRTRTDLLLEATTEAEF